MALFTSKSARLLSAMAMINTDPAIASNVPAIAANCMPDLAPPLIVVSLRILVIKANIPARATIAPPARTILSAGNWATRNNDPARIATAMAMFIRDLVLICALQALRDLRASSRKSVMPPNTPWNLLTAFARVNINPIITPCLALSNNQSIISPGFIPEITFLIVDRIPERVFLKLSAKSVAVLNPLPRPFTKAANAAFVLDRRSVVSPAASAEEAIVSKMPPNNAL